MKKQPKLPYILSDDLYNDFKMFDIPIENKGREEIFDFDDYQTMSKEKLVEFDIFGFFDEGEGPKQQRYPNEYFGQFNTNNSSAEICYPYYYSSNEFENGMLHQQQYRIHQQQYRLKKQKRQEQRRLQQQQQKHHQSQQNLQLGRKEYSDYSDSETEEESESEEEEACSVVRRKRATVVRRKRAKRPRGLKNSQEVCIVIGCKNRCKNRLRFSLKVRTEEDFKKGFMEKNFDRICDKCYFKDLYESNKAKRKMREAMGK